MGLIEACRKEVTFFSKRLQPPWLAGLPIVHLEAEQGEGKERGEALGRGWGSVPAVSFAGAWWCVRTCGVTAARAGLGWAGRGQQLCRATGAAPAHPWEAVYGTMCRWMLSHRLLRPGSRPPRAINIARCLLWLKPSLPRAWDRRLAFNQTVRSQPCFSSKP